MLMRALCALEDISYWTLRHKDSKDRDRLFLRVLRSLVYMLVELELFPLRGAARSVRTGVWKHEESSETYRHTRVDKPGYHAPLSAASSGTKSESFSESESALSCVIEAILESGVTNVSKWKHWTTSARLEGSERQLGAYIAFCFQTTFSIPQSTSPPRGRCIVPL